MSSDNVKGSAAACAAAMLEARLARSTLLAERDPHVKTLTPTANPGEARGRWQHWNGAGCAASKPASRPRRPHSRRRSPLHQPAATSCPATAPLGFFVFGLCGALYMVSRRITAERRAPPAPAAGAAAGLA